jgi:hypothetical protein
MGFSVGFVNGFVGVLILSHAAYSTTQCMHIILSLFLISFLLLFSDCSSFLLFLFICAGGGGDSDKSLLKITEDEFSGPPLNVAYLSLYLSFPFLSFPFLLFLFFADCFFFNLLFGCVWMFMQVVVELIVGLVLCTWAAITVPGIFLSIHPHSDDNR